MSRRLGYRSAVPAIIRLGVISFNGLVGGVSELPSEQTVRLESVLGDFRRVIRRSASATGFPAHRPLHR
ncbi:MAG: hypothetical protein ACRD11_11825 [Terriglobia bacterium]